MKETTKQFVLKGLWIAIGVFALRCLLFNPEDAYGYFGAMGEAVSISLILLTLYEKAIWKYNPFEKTPKIYGGYSGTLEYEQDGEIKKKETRIAIKQSLLSVRVRITTNETTSNTIVSNLILENDEYVLYYTYITNPQSKFRDKNPIQYGTCRFDLADTSNLHGFYWTSRKTKGDIYLKRGVE